MEPQSATAAAVAAAAAVSVAAAAVLGCSSCLRRRPPRAGAGETAAVVSGVYIYPVKSTAEISVQCARVTAQGFASDRVFQVVSARGNSEGRGDAHGVETALSSTPWAAGRTLGRCCGLAPGPCPSR